MDTALKQRLVGASVLIALAVVVLPMLLGGRPDHANPESREIQLPSQPAELDFETRKYPVGEERTAPAPSQTTSAPKPLPSPSRPVQSPPAESGDTEVMQTTEPREGLPPVTSIEVDDAKPEAVDPLEPADQPVSDAAQSVAPPVAGTEPPAPSGAGRYVVQVASFGAAANARRLSENLRNYGYAVMVDSVTSDVGTLHRVRVGPYGSEQDARAASDKLQVQVEGIKPRIMDLQPEQATQRTRPADPLARWVVQVGSFSSAANADKLVARLMLESLTAYKEQVTRSGNVIYRVRVGPFLDREEAIQADSVIAERLAIDGVVMSAD